MQPGARAADGLFIGQTGRRAHIYARPAERRLKLTREPAAIPDRGFGGLAGGRLLAQAGLRPEAQGRLPLARAVPERSSVEASSAAPEPWPRLILPQPPSTHASNQRSAN